jgi:hypothetical protein
VARTLPEVNFIYTDLATKNVIFGILAAMKPVEHNLPVTINQILSWVKQCTAQERDIILKELITDKQALQFASEKSLAKDWISEEEDEAWKNL